jgi:pimeloyl-ACP methyl ester carboxylesterase
MGRFDVANAALERSVPDSVSDEIVTVADLAVRVLRKGEGPPLVVVHGSLGNLGWLPLYDRLAGSFTVFVPDLPCYGGSERPEWARSPRDMAILVHLLLDELGVDGAALVGLGFGGFIAAEMATMHQTRFSRLVLVGATGIRPREGQIADQMLLGFAEFGLSGFRDPASFQQLFGGDSLPPDVYQLWDTGTEMTARVCWKPWMYSQQLPQLIKQVRVPTLLVWGEQDRLVPIDVAHQYVGLMPDAHLEMVGRAGHFVDLEQPDELADLILRHVGARQGEQA